MTNSMEVTIALEDSEIQGNLTIPGGSKGLVLFAHGSGSSRFSPRNRRVAEILQENRFSTLLMDLLTPEEEKIDLQTRELRFDIGFLAERLTGAALWVKNNPDTKGKATGYFGSSTGAAAALIAAAELPGDVSAVVSRGGRPDLALDVLPDVKAPTLLIVGGDDRPVIAMNREALERLGCEKRLEIVPGATHLFEEPGKLDEVANLASAWFARHLA